ncbi:dual specificity protein phosphatase 12 [Lepisosteus oculatus]|uniref:Dual specificity protein phosphatase 12 n=1 Tax=Lepisosteus oculatus TaxID=7918 RepID=W5LZD2_LEPOC|nr:PREDICTED: dual specificity protein phosphatase 12 [Lepisosteus oculatus]XP_015210523.1 PREDICTED: dual specificity protein phosphatase 12 [Lepisosteus oculatus]
MICVQTGLYIGAASDLKDCQSLTADGITHVLTVDSEAPNLPGCFQSKFVYALDESCTDLLSSLDDCVTFISEAFANPSSAVLVHCHAGQSRSAAVVTAFLMTSNKVSLMTAYTTLQKVKPDVRINDEFLDQLELYEMMGCEVDFSSPLYKQYRLKKLTEKYPELQSVPKEVFAADPTTSGQTRDNDIIYRCRKCRRTLFRNSSILSHNAGTGPTAFAHKKIGSTIQHAGSAAQRQCTSHFIEPVQWMEPALLGVLDGQLLCPKCSSKLGSFNWYGEQCSCGRWVTPAFQIHKNRVDEIKPLHVPGLLSGNS